MNDDSEDEALPKRHPLKNWRLQLPVFILFGLLVHWLWRLATKRFSCLPEMDSGELLAILAIAFAAVQFLDARDQERELNAISGRLKVEADRLKTQIEAVARQSKTLGTTLENQTSDLREISGSISTRFVGPFPDNIGEIIALLKTARRQIEVVVDFPGYGQYSALQSHLAYSRALLDARLQHVRVQIICYQLPLVSKERLEQFPDVTPEQWAQKSHDRKFSEYFDFFTGIRAPSDSAGLREVLTTRDRSLMKEFGDRGIEWKFHPEPAAFFLWMVDGAQAIFTFKNVGRKDVGLSFRTHDGNLMTQFRDIFARRWNNAKDDYDPPAAP